MQMKHVKLVIIILFFLTLHTAHSQEFAYNRWAPYRTFIEEQLKQHQLPLHYAYLPLLQTDCNIHHRNPHGSGAWALSMAAARHYGLHILPGYDERHDIWRSSEAAIAYLADLYQLYNGDSEKTLAQFMRCTPRSANSNEISTDYLLRRLQESCPTDTTAVKDNLEIITIDKSIYFKDFCQFVGIDSLTLINHNPSILPKAKYLHASCRLYLPNSHYEQWVAASDTLYSQAIDKQKSQVTIPTVPPKPEPSYIVYRVKSGDTLGHIALRYHVGVSQLKRWNHLHSDMLQIGQRLKIYR